ncbi:hypothetical protein AALA82_19410, partial [Oscillospiraceae bacterium 50-16]
CISRQRAEQVAHCSDEQALFQKFAGTGLGLVLLFCGSYGPFGPILPKFSLHHLLDFIPLDFKT